MLFILPGGASLLLLVRDIWNFCIWQTPKWLDLHYTIHLFLSAIPRIEPITLAFLPLSYRKAHNLKVAITFIWSDIVDYVSFLTFHHPSTPLTVFKGCLWISVVNESLMHLPHESPDISHIFSLEYLCMWIDWFWASVLSFALFCSFSWQESEFKETP